MYLGSFYYLNFLSTFQSKVEYDKSTFTKPRNEDCENM